LPVIADSGRELTALSQKCPNLRNIRGLEFMGWYDTQEVCLNGHQTTANYERHGEFRRPFCEKCGAPTIHTCPSCGTNIRGEYHVDGVVFLGSHATPVPKFCLKCGKKFPWSDRIDNEASDAITGLDPALAVERICSRVPLVIRQLRQRHDDRSTIDVNDEYDLQDVLHALLHLFFDDVRPEEYISSYAGKSSRVDFLLKQESIVLEAKMTRKGLGAKEIGDQLIIDIARYKEHASCKTLFCLVYDPDHRVNNPRGLEIDLSKKHDELDVRVFVVPKS
jgi:hypothetical protein